MANKQHDISQSDDDDEIPSQGFDIADAAAIVCTHVATGGEPIRVARRDESVDPVDTGWQFHCDLHDHGGDADAVVWSIRHVVETDPTVRPILDNPPGVAFRRETPADPWAPEPYDDPAAADDE
jgi:hypothetical protein